MWRRTWFPLELLPKEVLLRADVERTTPLTAGKELA